MSLNAFLVEDNPVIRANLAETLQELAAVNVVGEATGAQQAFDWLASHPDRWKIAVIDLFLAEGNGLSVLVACRQRSPQQKVVVLSNYATVDMRRRCLGLGADAVFDKSTELDAFIDYCVALGESRRP